ncbi:unnamed protein product [Prorocentrum cordatum]|uniref:Uncharacterized protein n=1 Tax=Prorocentrum cordatum TaxID=2364126 RepID=A0ABN9VEV3_9DINO|nr:unnamed protein product [Polarella glacialis]
MAAASGMAYKPCLGPGMALARHCGSSTLSAVDGEKLQVDDGMRMPVSLVDVQLEDKSGAALLGKADAFRAERGAWSVILSSSKPGTASLAPPGSIREKGSKEAWVAPVRLEKVVRDGREQSGVFATREFLPGDCIFVEAPILAIEEVGDVDQDMKGLKINKAHRLAVQQFLALPDQRKGAALSLFCPDRMLVTLGDGQKQWSEPLSKETFFDQLPKVGIQVGDDEDDKAVVWRFIRIWESSNMAVAAGTAIFVGAGADLRSRSRPGVLCAGFGA